MATIQFGSSALVCDRTPSNGYMTIGKNSSGVNRAATVTYPPLCVEGEIENVQLLVQWNNGAAGEGFGASTVHQAVSCGVTQPYTISGASGTVAVPLSGYSTQEAFTVRLSGQSTNAKSTSKGVKKSPVILVTYTPAPPPGTVRNMQVKTAGAYRQVAGMDARVQGAWKHVLGAAVKQGDAWEVLF